MSKIFCGDPAKEYIYKRRSEAIKDLILSLILSIFTFILSIVFGWYMILTYAIVTTVPSTEMFVSLGFAGTFFLGFLVLSCAWSRHVLEYFHKKNIVLKR